MGLLQNIAKNKEFKNNLTAVDFLYDETRKAIRPCWNVFYHYNYLALRMHNCEQSITQSDIRASVVLFRSYIDQLIKKIKEISNTLQENPKFRGKYYQELRKIKKFFPNLHSEISSLAKSIRGLDYYTSYEDLILIVKLIDPIINKLWLASEKKNLEYYETDIEKTRL